MEKEYLIKQWLADKLTKEELEAFKELEDYQLNLDIVNYASNFKASQWSSVDQFQTFSNRIPQRSAPVRKISWTTQLLRVAAILVVGITIYYFYPSNSAVMVLTGLGEKTKVELPDKSVIMVNAESEISYERNNWKNNKEVNLVGEAFFEVVSEGSFEVITSQGVISVLGTKFNIRQRGEYFEVKCFEGIVSVTSTNYSEELRAGDYLKSVNGILTMGTHVHPTPTWTAKISSFQEAPVIEVFEEIERQYSITVNVVGISKERLFTGGFVHDNLENALRSVTEPLNLIYQFESPNQVTVRPSEN